MIPNVKLKVPVPYTTEYGSPIMNNPMYRSGIVETETDVSLEYAAFLADEGLLDIEHYVSELHEKIGDAFDVDDFMIEFNEAVQNNRTSWEDWV